MPIPRMGVVLNGGANDREALLAAVRMAAREQSKLRIVLAAGCSREDCEKHLDFALWDVQERLRLPAPEITVESRVAELVVNVQAVDVSDSWRQQSEVAAG